MDGATQRVPWRSFPLFEHCQPASLAAISAIATTRRWAAGETLFQRGDDGAYLLAITEGRVKLSLGTLAGKELSLRFAEAGTVLGEMAVLDAQPRSADATASTAVIGQMIGRDDFLRLMALHPDLAQAVVRYLCERLRETTDQLESIALYDLEPRLARFFVTTLNQIHGEDLPDEARLRLSLSQGEIAGVLGASRPKVNRALMALEEQGAIARDGLIIDCRVDMLLALAEPEEN